MSITIATIHATFAINDYSIVLGWRMLSFVTLRTEYTFRQIEVVDGVNPSIREASSQANTWAIEVAAEVRNASRTAERTRVSLVLGENRIATADLELAPGETRTVPLVATAHTAQAAGCTHRATLGARR